MCRDESAEAVGAETIDGVRSFGRRLAIASIAVRSCRPSYASNLSVQPGKAETGFEPPPAALDLSAIFLPSGSEGDWLISYS